MAKFVPSSKRNQELKNLVDDFFSDNWLRRNLMGESFKLDVEETDSEYIVHAELPGVQKSELQVKMNDGTLTISVNKEEEASEEKNNYIHKERNLTSMSRNIYLVDAESDNIKAKLDQGVLTVTVRKQEHEDNSIDIDIE